MLKRSIDILASLCGLVLLAPVLIVVAYLVKRKLGSPVLFRQVRPGLNAKPFTMVKFRTCVIAVDGDGNPLPDSMRMTRFGMAFCAPVVWMSCPNSGTSSRGT